MDGLDQIGLIRFDPTRVILAWVARVTFTTSPFLSLHISSLCTNTNTNTKHTHNHKWLFPREKREEKDSVGVSLDKAKAQKEPEQSPFLYLSLRSVLSFFLFFFLPSFTTLLFHTSSLPVLLSASVFHLVASCLEKEKERIFDFQSFPTKTYF
jgi:hypothetical protein